MSSRAVRKALKRREAQKDREKEVVGDVDIEEEEEDGDDEIAAPANPFAMV